MAAECPATMPPLDAIADIVNGEIAASHIPGAVVIVGHDGAVVYRRAFGNRSLAPAKTPMTTDTIFDVASLTKVIATTTAVMQMVEAGNLALDSPIAAYWPEFAAKGKAQITLRDALTHYSGLAPDLDSVPPWHGYNAAMQKIVALRPVAPRGTRYIYSDVNFEVLGELVRRVSGEPLDVYCRRHIFNPLAMRDTYFHPPLVLRGRIAPTRLISASLHLSTPHDPTARRMGGVAGHAGLFSTADDLAAYAQMMLDGGRYRGARILAASTVDEMTAPESPVSAPHPRGFGWDLAPPLASNRYDLPPVGSYGHTGYTGTILWIDPATKSYVIILTNRVYINRDGDAEPLRTRILALVSESMGPLSKPRLFASEPALGTWCATSPLCAQRYYPHHVATGVDVFESQHFAALAGRRIGLITNRSGTDSAGHQTSRVMSNAPSIQLTALFTPEHGLLALDDSAVPSGLDSTTGLPVFSLYGMSQRPTDSMLTGIDALVFDLQDSGARFYTYETTMAYAIEAAARRNLDFYVLDRPDPISAAVVEGPVMDIQLKSFTGYFPLPTRHGMTLGELAEMFNNENHIGARLHVIRMRGYHRSDWYDQTGLNWIPPSPNLRTLAEAVLYPGIGLAEGANVSVGRGTDTPFELIGAPWVDSYRLGGYLNARHIDGVYFETRDFTPSADSYADQLCHGMRIIVTERDALDTPLLGIEVIAALYHLYPRDFKVDSTLSMVGSPDVLEKIKAGDDPTSIARGWMPDLQKFRLLRAKYLLY